MLLYTVNRAFDRRSIHPYDAECGEDHSSEMLLKMDYLGDSDDVDDWSSFTCE